MMIRAPDEGQKKKKNKNKKKKPKEKKKEKEASKGCVLPETAQKNVFFLKKNCYKKREAIEF